MASNAKNLAEYLNNQTTSATADIADGSITTDKLAADAVTAAKLADNAVVSANLSAGTLEGSGVNLGRRNIIINGAMQVAQRGTSSTGVGADGVSGYHNIDRMRIAIGTTSAGRVSMTQTAVTDLAGFSKSLKIQCTTIDTSIAAGERLVLNYRFEGQDLQRLKASSSSTKAFTISFYARANAAFNLVSEIIFGADTSKNSEANQVNALTTSWQRFTMTVPAATNTQIDNVTTHDTDLMFWMHAGSTYQGGSNSTTLRPNVNANRGNGASSIFASTNNFIEITGIQMEVGSAATDFEHLSFGEEFNLCKRYFQTLGYQYGDTIGGTNNYNGAIDAPILSTESGYSYYGGSQYPIQMRAQPTITIYARVSGTETAGKLIDFNGGGDLGNSTVNRIRANGYGYLQSASGNNYGAVYRSVSNAEL